VDAPADTASRFIRYFNEIDEYFRKATRSQRLRSFPERVAEVARRNATVRRFRDDLRDFSELRNAIVHDRYFPERIIAEPTAEATEQLGRICAEIVTPTRLIPAFARDIRTFRPEDCIIDALRWLRDKDFSQAVVFDGKLALLTLKGIARWLAAQTELECLELQQVKVADALAFEVPDCFIVMSRNATVDEAREMFEQQLAHGQRTLFAILVTETGKNSQQPLGIVTPYDLIEEGGEEEEEAPPARPSRRSRSGRSSDGAQHGQPTGQPYVRHRSGYRRFRR
jgi:predicted transcriptional regulator